jgi:hypothetical protein
MLGCCGLDCTKCDAFIATANKDDALRAKVAEEWTKAYQTPIAPENVNCTGCHSNGAKIYYCEHQCAVRKCVLSRKLENCAPCQDYPCEHLAPILKMAPHAKQILESLRKMNTQ